MTSAKKPLSRGQRERDHRSNAGVQRIWRAGETDGSADFGPMGQLTLDRGGSTGALERVSPVFLGQLTLPRTHFA